MRRRNIHLRREYLSRKSSEGKGGLHSGKKLKINKALQGKPITTELRNEEAALRQEIDLEDESPAVAKRHVEDEYANAMEKDPNILLTTSRNPSAPLTQFVKLWLHEWWLIKADKGGLAVAGLVSGQSKVARLFCSAAIAKRHDCATLETTDGYLITISDSIDRFHSVENGFPPEVCNQFLFGFPTDWEDFAKCYCIGESATQAAGPEISCLAFKTVDSFKELSPGSLDDLPPTKIRDLVLSPNYVVGKRVLDDALSRHYDENTEILATMESENTVKDSGTYSERKRINKKNRVQQTSGDVDVMYEPNVTEACATTNQLRVDTDVPTPKSDKAARQLTMAKELTDRLAVNSSTDNCVLTVRTYVATRRSPRLNKSTDDTAKLEPKKGTAAKSSSKLKNTTEGSSTATPLVMDIDVLRSGIATGQSPTFQTPTHQGAAKFSTKLKKTNELVDNRSDHFILQESNNQFSPSKVTANSSHGRMITRSQKRQFSKNIEDVTAMHNGSREAKVTANSNNGKMITRHEKRQLDGNIDVTVMYSGTREAKKLK